MSLTTYRENPVGNHWANCEYPFNRIHHLGTKPARTVCSTLAEQSTKRPYSRAQITVALLFWQADVQSSIRYCKPFRRSFCPVILWTRGYNLSVWIAVQPSWVTLTWPSTSALSQLLPLGHAVCATRGLTKVRHWSWKENRHSLKLNNGVKASRNDISAV